MTVEASINPLGPSMPLGFTHLINLQELYLNDTFLEYLPANFGRYKHRHPNNVTLTTNSFSPILSFAFINRLARLQIVELRENHLKTLPKSMTRLVELKRLDIGQNDFIEFPEVIGCLPNLTELWCDFNKLVSITEVIE